MSAPLVSTQFVFFTDTTFTSQQHPAILSKFTSLYQGSTTIIPLPEEAPPELPRMIVFSAENDYQLVITKKRTDVIYNAPPVSFENPLPKNIQLISDTTRKLIEIDSISITQIAFIVRYVLTKHNKKNLSKFLNPDGKIFVTDDSSEQMVIKQRTKQSIDLNGHASIVNQWVNLDDNLLNSGDNTTAILFEFEMNTLQNTLTVKPEDIEAFVKTVAQKHVDVVKDFEQFLR